MLARFSNGDRRVALTGAALFEKRADMVAIDWLRQVIMEPSHSRHVDIRRDTGSLKRRCTMRESLAAELH